MTTISPVILCGGSGTRLWPLSRSGFPKQFLVLGGKKSTLFQEALLRMYLLCEATSINLKLQDPFSVTNEEHRFLVLEQLRELDSQQSSKKYKSSVSQKELPSIILEPSTQNTAPALSIAALEAINAKNDPILVVTPADQMVKDQDKFVHAIRAAIQSALDGSIVILGITPNKPETGYGYIKCGTDKTLLGALNVEQFIEKPDQKLANQYLEAGNYFWNAGMFVVKAST